MKEGRTGRKEGAVGMVGRWNGRNEGAGGCIGIGMKERYRRNGRR